MTSFEFFNGLVGTGVLFFAAITLSVLILCFLKETTNRYFIFFKKHSFGIALVMALSAVIGSLSYEFIFGLPPCTFCWWQRIFMYPQIIILSIGIYTKDIKIWLTSIILSVIGACFSIYHILIQAGIRSSGLPCELNGVSCTKIDVLIFGWLTIPMMCLVLFIGILTFAYLAHKKTA